MQITNNSLYQVESFFADDPIILFAKEELDRYWKKVFSPHPNHQENTVHFVLKKDQVLRFDGYSLTIQQDHIIISSSCSRGILYGVYEFLKLLGCQFLFPSDSWQIVPSLEEFYLEEQTILKDPWIELRGLCLYNTTAQTLQETLDIIDHMGKNGYNLLLTSVDRLDDSVDHCHAILWNQISKELYPQLKKRGIFIDMSEHSTDYFFPREKWFSLHPEWFSLIDGRRAPMQICYSNQDAVAEYARSYREFSKTNYDFDMLGIWPLDGGGYCQCEQCSDPLTVLRATIKVASEIQKVRPDLIIEHLAYTPQSFTCPQEPLPENLSILVCDTQDIVAYEWGLKAKNKGGAFYFDYHTGDNYRFRSNLWINPFYCRDMVNTFATYDYRGIISLYLPITSWWQSSINYYYLSTAYYEPLFDVEIATSKLAKMIFGKTNQVIMTKILMKIIIELQDENLWSCLPHKPENIVEHIANRNHHTDLLHRKHFEQIYAKLQELLSTVQAEVFSEKQNLQFQYVKAYLHLQKLFFTNIDQYDFESDTALKAEPYFEALKSLENDYGKVFSTTNYARWRIVGRDNIFDPKKAGDYQPQL